MTPRQLLVNAQALLATRIYPLMLLPVARMLLLLRPNVPQAEQMRLIFVAQARCTMTPRQLLVNAQALLATRIYPLMLLPVAKMLLLLRPNVPQAEQMRLIFVAQARCTMTPRQLVVNAQALLATKTYLLISL